MEFASIIKKQPAMTLSARLWQALWQVALLLILAIAAGLVFNQFGPKRLPLVADWSPAARPKAATGQDMVIPVEKASEFYDTREAVFVDARSADLYAEGHIDGAINLPFEDVNAHIGAFFNRVPDKDTIVITYCDGETCSLGEDLALLLKDIGYTNVRVVINGWTVWSRRGFPIAKGVAEGGP